MTGQQHALVGGDRVTSTRTVGVGTVITEHRDGTVQVRWDGDTLSFPVKREHIMLLPPAPAGPLPGGTNPKDLIGVTKPQLHLVPPAAVIRMAKVMELGATKYGAYNWRRNKVRLTVYLSAALRHIMQCLDGEDVDPESGQTHLAHAMACFAIVIDAMETGNLVDDRPDKGAAGRLIADLTEGGKP